jgi:hypothetical protein
MRLPNSLSWILVVVLGVASLPLSAQLVYSRVLIPVHVGTSVPLPGANGSLWVSYLTAYNANETPATIAQEPGPCGVGNCAQTVWPPHAIVSPFGGGHRGAFMNIQAADETLIKFNLRIQDISRLDRSWGVELPVVTKSEYSATAIDLLDIPLNSQFRQTTRIYDYDAAAPRVMVRVFPMDTARSTMLLGEKEVQLAPAETLPRQLRTFPSYAQLGEIATEFPGAAGEERVRLQIRPLVPGTLIWAFTSITHNESQHVTVVTPQ